MTAPAQEPTHQPATVLEARAFSVSYAGKPAVRAVDLIVPANRITALIGPSGCGKSTLLRSFNRMNDFIPEATHEGKALFHGGDVHSRDIDPVDLRRRIGMVFQRPNPFPRSILSNVTWGPKINGYRGDLRELAERALRQAALWDEVSSRLDDSALALSGGQQQRLCIARAIAMEPEVILLDEPCSALDPISTARIEELLVELKRTYTLVIVTHNMQQAARLSDFAGFLDLGVLVEHAPTEIIFQRPTQQRTLDYVTGRFG